MLHGGLRGFSQWSETAKWETRSNKPETRLVAKVADSGVCNGTRSNRTKSGKNLGIKAERSSPY
jgi:hypothetical protein